MKWDIEFTDEFGQWWNILSEEEQEDVAATVEVLEERGPTLREPLSKVILSSRHHPDLKELRISSTGGDRLRVFYAFDPQRTAILLIGGNKTGRWEKFYDEFIPFADALYDEHLRELNNNRGKR